MRRRISGEPSDTIVEEHVVGAGSAVYIDDQVAYFGPDGSIVYLHGDSLCTTAALTDEYRAIIERYATEPYAAATIYDGAMDTIRTTSDFGVPWVHQGMPIDQEIRHKYNRNRQLNTGIGAFQQRDPFGYIDGYNLYEYEASSPFDGVDPFGLDLVILILGEPGGGSEWLAERLAANHPGSAILRTGPAGARKVLRGVLRNPLTTQLIVISHGTDLGSEGTKGNIKKRFSGLSLRDGDGFLISTKASGEAADTVYPHHVAQMYKNPNLESVELYSCYQGTPNRKLAWDRAFGLKVKAYPGPVHPSCRALVE